MEIRSPSGGVWLEKEVRVGKDVPGINEAALFPVPKDLVFQCLTEAAKARRWP